MTGQTKIGRPRESRDGQARDKEVKIRFTAAEVAWLDQQATDAGVSRVEWMRRRLLRGYRPGADGAP